MFSGKLGRVLLDPLLDEGFGHLSLVGRVYPPRIIDLTKWPAVDAVFLTHEHEDHFNIATLKCLDTHIPIYISNRSSMALAEILKEAGFHVRAWAAGKAIRIGDLDIIGFPTNYLEQNNTADEWDVIPFVVRDRQGDGTFFSSVDVPPPTSKAIRTIVERAGIWSYTNNNVSLRALSLAGSAVPKVVESASSIFSGRPILPGKPIDPPIPLSAALPILQEHAIRFRDWQAPALVLFNGGGMSFTTSRDWMNRNCFPLASDALAAAMAVLCPGQRFVAPLPGQTFVMRDFRIVDEWNGCDYLAVAPKSMWPDRRYLEDVDRVESYEPLCDDGRVTDQEFNELITRLADFATFLYGTPLFRALYSFDPSLLQGHKQTCAFVLIFEQPRRYHILEYDPVSCRFVPVEKYDPLVRHVTGLECYARDLLACMRGEIPPSALTFGHARVWDVTRSLPSLRSALWLYHHPLRRPDAYLGMYRRILQSLPECPHVIPAGRS